MIKRIIRGMRYSEKYGDHPGTIIAIGMPIAGFIAGLDKGLIGGIYGLVIMSMVIIPLYLVGCYERGDV